MPHLFRCLYYSRISLDSDNAAIKKRNVTCKPFFVAPLSIVFFALQDLHVAYTVALVTGVFAICWLPFFLVNLIFKWCASCTFVWDMRVLMAVKLLHYGNSALNPIIYSVRNRRFNHAFKRILLRMVCRKMDTGYSGMNNSARQTQQTRIDTNMTMTMTERCMKSSPQSLSQSDDMCTTKLV